LQKLQPSLPYCSIPDFLLGILAAVVFHQHPVASSCRHTLVATKAPQLVTIEHTTTAQEQFMTVSL
jgi:hypothetical protein